MAYIFCRYQLYKIMEIIYIQWPKKLKLNYFGIYFQCFFYFYFYDRWRRTQEHSPVSTRLIVKLFLRDCIRAVFRELTASKMIIVWVVVGWKCIKRYIIICSTSDSPISLRLSHAITYNFVSLNKLFFIQVRI